MWLRSMQSKTNKLKALLKPKSYTQEGLGAREDEPYLYFVSSPKMKYDSYNVFTEIWSILFEDEDEAVDNPV